MSNSSAIIENNLMLEKIRNSVLIELEKRVEKHLKNEFYNKILPKLIQQVKQEVIIDLVSGQDFLDLHIAIKPKQEEQEK